MNRSLGSQIWKNDVLSPAILLCFLPSGLIDCLMSIISRQAGVLACFCQIDCLMIIISTQASVLGCNALPVITKKRSHGFDRTVFWHRQQYAVLSWPIYLSHYCEALPLQRPLKTSLQSSDSSEVPFNNKIYTECEYL